MNIRLHIERVILNDVPISSAQSPILGKAVEAELVRLLTEGGLNPDLQSGGALANIPANSIHVPSNAGPSHWGQQIAQSVYDGIGSKK
jgi:hypothetical protein